MFLEKINSVDDLKKLSVKDLDILAEEIREYIIDVVSKNGGHIASSLGVVELTIALHYIYNTPHDKIIWDVGHQAYAHKILTGRREEFKTIRKFGGISGFPKINESKFDAFNVGHSSTSLSFAIGEAVSRDLQNNNYDVLPVIGDGSLTGGIAFEALNQIGHLGRNLTIILNDNEHSISPNVGAMSHYLTSIITGKVYTSFRRKAISFTRKIPFFGNSIYHFVYRVFGSLKTMLIPGQFFEDMGIRYFGPIDGHNISAMIELFKKVKSIDSGPKIIHVITKKGKGYKSAEDDPSTFHGIGPFDKKTGKVLSIKTNKIFESYSKIASKTLVALARNDKKIVTITAAMKLGTGFVEFEKNFPDRFFDVGIAEQHAIAFSGAMAKAGLKPFVSIYSTFLQRAVDQLIHDVAIMNMPIKLLIDRAGIVGDDGETHHGVFDIPIIKNIPNFIFLAPSNSTELRDMICFAAEYNDGPIAIRFPRGKADVSNFSYANNKKFVPGKLKRLTRGTNVAIFAVGDMVDIAKDTHKLLKKDGIAVSVVNLLSLKPLDWKNIIKIVKETDCFLTLENGVISGGIGESLVAGLDCCLHSKFLFYGGFSDEFVTQGSILELFKLYKLDAESLANRIKLELSKNEKN